MKLGYYPGCVAGSTAKEYDTSMKLVFSRLGLELEEVPGWKCCGAFEGAVAGPLGEITIPAYNLALYAKKYSTMVISCAACFSNHARANFNIKTNPKLRKKVEEIIEDTIGDILRFVPYYGCSVLRPSKMLGTDDPENPSILENLIQTLGGEVVRFPLKSRCCGGAVLMADKPLAKKLTGKLWEEIEKAKPDAVVVMCPQCHLNLESIPMELETIKADVPVIYFTQMMGLAFGIDSQELGLDKHLISAGKLLEQLEKIAV